MPAYGFGSGNLFGYRTDVATPQPIQFGALQDVTVDINFNVKELFGQNQFPVAVARSTGKITGKAKMGRIQAAAFNELFFGQTLASGQKVTAVNEGPTPIPTTPFTITVANGTTWVEDLGVFDATTGQPFTRVSTAPAAGQYSVAAGGVYTFAAADNTAARKVNISYTYTIAATGQKMTVTNQVLGSAPQFKAVLFETYQGNKLQLELFACISTKLSIPTKMEDFVIPELDFSAFADSSGNVLSLSFAE